MIKYKQSYLSLVFCALLLPTGVTATTFVTDKLIIDVYAEHFATSSVVTNIPTGTPVKVLQEQGDYTEISTQDNITGWVLSKYLSVERPIQLEYVQLITKYNTLQEKLKAIEPELAKNRKLRKKLKSVAKLRKNLVASQEEIKRLQDTIAAKDQTLANAVLPPDDQPPIQALTPQPAGMLVALDIESLLKPTPMAAAAIALLVSTFILGIFIGYRWLDRKIRKRHGGIRLY